MFKEKSYHGLVDKKFSVTDVYHLSSFFWALSHINYHVLKSDEVLLTVRNFIATKK
jgi:prenyltransferase beta subunit